MQRLVDFLTADDPSDELVVEVCSRLGLVDWPVAVARLNAFRRLLPDATLRIACLERLLLSLDETPHPDNSLLNFERWLHSVPDPVLAAQMLVEQPRAIEILVKLFVSSQYLTDTLVRHPEYLLRLTQHKRLAEIKSRPDLYDEMQAVLAESGNRSEQADALRRYQRGEILRIGACDTFGLMDLRTVTSQVSLLAETLVQTCLEMCAHDLQMDLQSLSVLGMGKLGGGELNYSSDIDLIFLTDQPDSRVVTLGQQLVRSLQTSTAEGFLYRVDMRLRPWGRAGELVTSRAAYRRYLQADAEIWERQALVKARVVAGNRTVGQAFLNEIEPILYSMPAKTVRESIRMAKEKIEQQFAKKGGAWGDVKHGQGSLRDIEFVTQSLQLTAGGHRPGVRSPNTLEALVKLADHDLIQADEYRSLSSGYVFLRTVEHALQLMHNTQEHALPTERRGLNYLARRLDFPDADRFLAAYERHRAAVRKVFNRHLVQGVQEAPDVVTEVPDITSRLLRLSEVFSEAERQNHRQLLLATNSVMPVQVVAEPLAGGCWRVTVLGIDHPGDLSMISGLLFVYGFNIVDGMVTTGNHLEVVDQLKAKERRRGPGMSIRRDFVNVFTVQPLVEGVEPEVWLNYHADLTELMLLSRSGAPMEAQGHLVKRVAAALPHTGDELRRLSPVEITVDNELHPHATVLDIAADDTMGFLYELSNALALCMLDIAGVEIRSEGSRVVDRLLVTDAESGEKIVDGDRLAQLRAAIVLIKHFTHLLPRSPNPEAALIHFRDLLRQVLSQPDWMDELASLDRPEVLSALAKLLGVSDFLWEDFLRLQYANLFPLLCDLSILDAPRSREDLQAEFVAECLQTADRKRARKRLNELKDREMFRVDMRHILGRIVDFSQFSLELTDIAEVVVDVALRLARQELEARHGQACLPDGRPCRMSVCALGKCGGQELGFASDIELMFVYEAEGQTNGPQPIACSLFAQQLVELFTQSIVARREGIFRIDLRLRPFGRSGSLAVALPAFESYFRLEGPAWPYERQALAKLRPIAGDLAFGQEIVRLRDQCVYTGEAFDFTAMMAIREKQMRQLVRAETFNAKLSAGGLVDIEYLTQALQMTYGQQQESLRETNTSRALDALLQWQKLSPEDHRILRDGLAFFRRLIDALRMVRGDARNLTVPLVTSEEFEFLCRRLGYEDNSQRLQADLDRHSGGVLEVQRKYREMAPSAGRRSGAANT